MRILDLATGGEVRTISAAGPGSTGMTWPSSPVFSPNGRVFTYHGALPGTLHVEIDGTPAWTAPQSPDGLALSRTPLAAFSPDGEYLRYRVGTEGLVRRALTADPLPVRIDLTSRDWSGSAPPTSPPPRGNSRPTRDASSPSAGTARARCCSRTSRPASWSRR